MNINLTCVCIFSENTKYKAWITCTKFIWYWFATWPNPWISLSPLHFIRRKPIILGVKILLQDVWAFTSMLSNGSNYIQVRTIGFMSAKYGDLFFFFYSHLLIFYRPLIPENKTLQCQIPFDLETSLIIKKKALPLSWAKSRSKRFSTHYFFKIYQMMLKEDKRKINAHNFLKNRVYFEKQTK